MFLLERSGLKCQWIIERDFCDIMNIWDSFDEFGWTVGSSKEADFINFNLIFFSQGIQKNKTLLNGPIDYYLYNSGTRDTFLMQGQSQYLMMRIIMKISQSVWMGGKICKLIFLFYFTHVRNKYMKSISFEFIVITNYQW